MSAVHTSVFPPLLPEQVQNRNQAFVDQHCDDHAEHPLDKRKRHVKKDQALQDGFHPRENRLIGCQDRLLRHEIVVNRVNDKIVGRHTDHRHQGSPQHCSEAGAFSGFSAPV